MSAHQMVCHLADGFRLYMSLKTARPVPVPYPRIVLKWTALWAPIPWPKGFKTAPELDQQSGGTPPAVFAADLRDLKNLVDHFTRQPRDFPWQPHPHFGRMSNAEGMRLAYLHMDHHLRHVYGYVVMPEHVHLLLSEPQRDTLADALKSLKQGVSRRLLGTSPLKPKAGLNGAPALNSAVPAGLGRGGAGRRIFESGWNIPP